MVGDRGIGPFSPGDSCFIANLRVLVFSYIKEIFNFPYNFVPSLLAVKILRKRSFECTEWWHRYGPSKTEEPFSLPPGVQTLTEEMMILL